MRQMTEQELVDLSRTRHLALSVDEMRAIQTHFRQLDRDPTEIELETIAQTWSEHCSHKTLKGRIDCGDRVYENLLGETIFAATQQIRDNLGADDWCVSVFEDNAGIVKFDDRFHLCFKVETHNRPSAIDPYRGAATGLGGVIRDVLGCGLGGKPIANTDVFCVGSLNATSVPPGVIHPRDILRGVVGGVADYGNHCGIPTVSGAVAFNDRYTTNPLVFCGTVGLIPVDRVEKSVRPGDRIVVIGGPTWRDGIHGATVSSEGIGASNGAASDAVQSGCPFIGKKLIVAVLRARDQDLFRSITDCGAGGFSSAVGEMCAAIGATVDLERVPLKGEGMSASEIWISESQERMVLAVPPENWAPIEKLCAEEGISAANIGVFESTGELCLRFGGEVVGQLSCAFLHNGRPRVCRTANFASHSELQRTTTPTAGSPTDRLMALLASPNVRSREAIIRQYDHEVQGAVVLRPLVGKQNDGSSDAAILAPILGSHRGVAIGCGLDIVRDGRDPYEMAAAAIDEAVRNVVAVGADPNRIALLDNFAWGDVDSPESLGALVRACEACRDVSLAWSMPFISGKDSLRNEFQRDAYKSSIPGTLLISAIGIVADVRRCVSMDLKEPGNRLVVIGDTSAENVEPGRARALIHALHVAISRGLVRACHDLSEGGLAVAAAEMAFSGGIGADLRLRPDRGEEVQLFGEAPTRWLAEVRPTDFAAFADLFSGLPTYDLGETVAADRLRVAGASGEWTIWAKLADLKRVWQTPLV